MGVAMYTSLLPRFRGRRQYRLDFLYEPPNPLVSLEQYEKFTHADLRRMSRALLKRELAKVRLRLIYDDNPPFWMIERLDAIRKALK